MNDTEKRVLVAIQKAPGAMNEFMPKLLECGMDHLAVVDAIVKLEKKVLITIDEEAAEKLYFAGDGNASDKTAI